MTAPYSRAEGRFLPGAEYHRRRMLCHWDDVSERPVDAGHVRAHLLDLGRASGTVHIGARRQRVAPRATGGTVHVHDAEEEICFVVAGSGLSWQDGTTYEVRAGDALLHSPGGAAHCLVAGDEGLTAIVFGERRPVEVGRLPRAGLARVGRMWTELGPAADSFSREAAAGPVAIEDGPAPRPQSIVNIADVPGEERDRGELGATIRNIGVALGSRTTGMRHATIAPGHINAPPHAHNAEEEMFVVLDGDGTLVLYDLDGAVTAEHPVRAGHVVARPAATGVAHTFRAGDGGITVLSYGQRRGEDVAWYPRSSKLAFRGFSGGGAIGGIVVKVERAGYWDGEA
jgi:uncharacterized cupin superfamily protein